MTRFIRPVVLYHYVAWEYLKHFGLALVVCTLIMLLATFVFRAAELEEYGVSVEQMAPLALYFLPYALAYSLPFSALIAAILVFGHLAAENEILAAQSAGASIVMLSLPVMFCGLVFCAVSLWCNDVGVGWGFSTLREEVFNISRPKVLERLDRPGQSLTWPLETGGAVHINILPIEREAGGAPRRPIHITYFEDGRLKQSLYARHHTRELLEPEKPGEPAGQKMLLILEEGQALDEGRSPDERMHLKRFVRLEHVVPLPVLSERQLSLGRTTGTVSLAENFARASRIRAGAALRQEFLAQQAAEMAASALSGSCADPSLPLLTANSWCEVQRAQALPQAAAAKMRKQMVEFHRKLSLSCIPFSMVILGLGVGLLVRRGHRLVGFVAGILIYFLLYYPLMALTKELGNLEVLPPVGLWTPNVVVMALGLALWSAHEHGYLGSGPPAWLKPAWFSAVGRALGRSVGWAWRPVARLGEGRMLPLRLRADRYVASLFMSPLLALVLAVAVLYVVLDLVEHGGEVVNGIMKAGEPLPTLPVRSMSQAVVDLGIYYGIRGLGMVFDLMPVLLLIAGVFAVWAMVRNNEHLIFKSSGTPLQRAFLPIVLLAVGLSLVISALREFVMPRLVMERDRLKPLVYHRSPRPKSLAGVAMDEQGRLVVYEIARYVNNALTCEGVRIYLPGESAGGRLPRLEADRAVWDPAHSRWDLKTAVRRPGEGKDGEAIYADYGLLFVPQTVKGDPLDDRARFLMQKAPHWAGQLTPGFLESQDLGPSVMRLGELLAASDRPAYRSELWRRGFEWLTGLLLLMVALPLIVRLEVTSLLLGIGWCIVCGAVYVGLILATTEAAREEVAPAWFPVLPHAVFLVLGVWRYAFRTET